MNAEEVVVLALSLGSGTAVLVFAVHAVKHASPLAAVIAFGQAVLLYHLFQYAGEIDKDDDE